jgi:hypothetical protein
MRFDDVLIQDFSQLDSGYIRRVKDAVSRPSNPSNSPTSGLTLFLADSEPLLGGGAIDLALNRSIAKIASMRPTAEMARKRRKLSLR